MTLEINSLFFCQYLLKKAWLENTQQCLKFLYFFFSSFSSSFLSLEVPLFLLLWCKFKLTTYVLLPGGSLVANVSLLDKVIDGFLL